MKVVLIIYNIPAGIESEFEPQINEYAFAIKKYHLEPLPIRSDQTLQYVERNKDLIAFAIYMDKDIYLATMLIKLGIKVFNSPKAILLCDDKALTYAQFVAHDIPTPDTFVLPYTFGVNILEKYPNIIDIIQNNGFSFPYIVKERHGSFGDQVYLLNNADEMATLLKNVGNSGLLVQKYIKEASGVDYRINVVGHKVICGVRRENKTNFKSNIHQGGIMIPLNKIDKNLKNIAVRASLSVSASFAGVDVVKDKDGNYLVLEVNSNARTVAVSKVTGVPLALSIIEYCVKHVHLYGKTKHE